MNHIQRSEPIYFAPTKKLGGAWIAYKDSPDAPEAPDYTAAAEATAAGNLEAVKYATEANRADQYTPWGSLTWKQDNEGGFNEAAYNAAMDKYYKELAAYNAAAANQKKTSSVSDPFLFWTGSGANSGNIGKQAQLVAPVKPTVADFTTSGSGRWTQTMSLTPEAQAALDAQLAVTNGRSQAALTLEQQVKDQLATPFDTSKLMEYRTDVPVFDQSSVDRYAKAAYDKEFSLLNPQYQQAETTLRNNLALQGLSNTSEAFGTDVGNFYSKKNDAMNQLADNSLLTGQKLATSDYQNQILGFNTNNSARASQLEQMLAEYNLPLNQLNALLSGQQVQQPTFSSYAQQQATSGPDYLTAAQSQYNADLGAYNGAAAGAASSNAGMGSAIGSIGAAALTVF